MTEHARTAAKFSGEHWGPVPPGGFNYSPLPIYREGNNKTVYGVPTEERNWEKHRRIEESNRGAIRFIRRADDLVESTCGRFTLVRSDYPVRRYLAWRRPTEPRQMATLLGGFDTADEARARCLDDALTAAAVQP